MTLSVFARILPKLEYFNDAKQAIINIMNDTRAETGCRTFTLHEDANGTSLYLFEIWDDAAALDAHYAQPYTKDVFAAYETWLATPVEVTRMVPVI